VNLSGVRGKGQRIRVALTAALAVAALMPLGAQDRPGAQPSAAAPQIEARREIFAFENVLENAVGYAAQMLIQHASMTPPPANNIRYDVLLTGEARARGFRLDGYGAMFDVEFPSIRRSVAFTMSTLGRPDPEALAAYKEMRRRAQDPQSQQALDGTIKALEDQINAYNARPKTVSAASGPAPAPAAADDPRVFYASELINALMTAIIDQGGTTGIGPDEWLTVAARESLDLRFMPDDPATTLIMRVKGSDLAALRDKRLTREDARNRIEVKQY
jgi:hypothetical protein